MTSRRIRGALAVAGAALVLALAGCGGAGRPHLGAAEPAVAPSGGPPPVGTVRAVGASPEGIVYDAKTGIVAVAVRDPDRLLLLDAATLAVEHTVALPGSVRHLQLAGPGGPVLVPCESARELVQVSLPDGAVVSSTAVGKQPHDATAAAGGLVVGNEFGSSLSVVRNGLVTKTLSGVRQPGGVTGEGDSVAVVDVAAFTLSTFDLATGERTAIVAAGRGPTHGIPISGGRFAVADTRGNQVLEYRLSPLEQIGHLALPGAPYGVAIDASSDTAWVTLTARNEVVGLDLSGGTPRLVARYPTVRQPNTVAVSPGSRFVWITGTANGQVQLISR